MICSHREAVLNCGSCVGRVRTRFFEFPLQMSSRAKSAEGPRTVPWSIAEAAWDVYAARYGREQSVERLAERGGFGWGEMDMFLPGWRELAQKAREPEPEPEPEPLRGVALLESMRDKLIARCLNETGTAPECDHARGSCVTFTEELHQLHAFLTSPDAKRKP